MKNLRFPAALLLASAAAVCGTASAQTKTWNFGDTTTPGSCTGAYSTGTTANFGNAIGCTQQPSGTVVDLTVRAYTNNTTTTTGTTTTFNTYSASGVNQQGTGAGFGVWSNTEDRAVNDGNHGVDNFNGTDMLLLSFTSAEVLRTVTVGWSGGDSDFSVLRWSGSTTASLADVQHSILGKTAGNLLTGGWTLVTNVDGINNVDNPDAVYNVSGGNTSSSYWLISAYNSAFGGGLSTGNDTVKVLGVTTRVSAPGTLALAGLALLGMGLLRRRSA